MTTQPVVTQPGQPLLYVFSEDDGSREGCSIFYARYLAVQTPSGGEAQVEAALDVILKRTAKQPAWGGPPVKEPDYADSAVEDMIGGEGDLSLLVTELARVGITAWTLRANTIVSSD